MNRLLILFALLFLALSFSARAQEDSLKDIAPAYLKEMDRFYAYCAKEPTLSEHYDCRCLSMKFLDKRRERGEDVRVDDILASIRGQCAQGEGEAPPFPADAALMGGYTQEEIDEADGVFQSCKSNPEMTMAYDCECFAAKYLDERVQRGPEPPGSYITMLVSQTCPNPEGVAGNTYESCLGRPGLMPLPRGKTVEQYCECYANEYAKLYKQAGQGYNSTVRVELQSRAMDACARD